MADRLRIDKLKENFSYDRPITRKELYLFYKSFNSTLKETTFRWILYELIDRNILFSLDRGIYSLYKNSDNLSKPYYFNEYFKYYQPMITKNLYKLYNSTKNKFPLIKFCVWETNWINEFMIHQPGKFLSIIEVENYALESVFYYLKTIYDNVYIKPNRNALDYYLYDDRDSIIIKRLISQSPIQNYNTIVVPKLEKILVDLFVEDDFFYPYQGQELTRIFNNALGNYKISRKSLFRYATRRSKYNKLYSFLKQHQLHNYFKENYDDKY